MPGMVEERHQSTDIVFSITCAFVDKDTEVTEESKLSK